MHHLRSDLKIGAVYIGPIFQSSTHGYDTVDYRLIDSRLGHNHDFQLLVAAYHHHHIKVVVDAVFNHVGRDFFAFQDVLHKRKQSAYCDWFMGLKFFPYKPDIKYDCWAGCKELVKLNVLNPAVRDYIFDTVRYWVDQFAVDGVRLDAADVVDKAFWVQFVQWCKTNLKAADGREFFVLGEITQGFNSNWVSPNMFHSITNYETYSSLVSAHQTNNLFELGHSLTRLFGNHGLVSPDRYLFNFVDNHDVNRISSRLSDKRHLSTVYMLVYCFPGSFSLYYGSEFGIQGVKGRGHSADDPLRPPLHLEDFPESPTSPEGHAGVIRAHDTKYERAVLGLTMTLGSIRTSPESQPLKEGSLDIVHLDHRQLVFTRKAENASIVVTVNIGDEPCSIDLTSTCQGKDIYDLLSHGNKLDSAKLNVPPYWGCVLYLLPSGTTYMPSTEILSSPSLNAMTVVEALRSGNPMSLMPVSRNGEKGGDSYHPTAIESLEEKLYIKIPPIAQNGTPGQAVYSSSTSAWDIPEWTRDALFYQVNVLVVLRIDPASEPRGSIIDLARDPWLTHISDLGVGCVSLGPLLHIDSSRSGLKKIDFTLDKRIGLRQDIEFLDAVVKPLHERGIHIVIQVANLRHHVQQYDSAEKLDFFFRALVTYLAIDLDLDGVQIFHAEQMTLDGIGALAAARKSILLGRKKEFVIIGDVRGNYSAWCDSKHFDMVTNSELRGNFLSSYLSHNVFEILHNDVRQATSYPSVHFINFIDNHDTERAASTLSLSKRLESMYVLLFSISKNPMIYYGSEFGMTGKRDGSNHDVRLQSFDLAKLRDDRAVPFDSCKRLGAFRASEAGQSLRWGTHIALETRNHYTVFVKQLKNHFTLVAVHLTDHSPVMLNLKDLPVVNGKLLDLLTDETFNVSERCASISLPAGSSRVVVVA